jgi:hypothetical protein
VPWIKARGSAMMSLFFEEVSLCVEYVSVWTENVVPPFHEPIEVIKQCCFLLS